jgi:transcriptional regulator of acetoin/glycerol metabolism/AraC-like DNA-binding protein
MASSARPVRAIDTPARHAERVHLVAQEDAPVPGAEEISNSWRRSANQHGVDPDSSEAPRILTSHELKEVREPLDRLILSAREELDRLYKVVREAGYTVLFCDTAGVAVEHRGERDDASRFKYWGTWLGGVWSETLEGTNGIGTCIAEERPVTVHRGQHYRSRNIDLSCSGAPIFDVDGRLTAVLDVSAIDPERSERAHALTGALTVASARAIEERFFREQFRQEWVVAVAPPEDGGAGMLLAADGNQRIVGANRTARTSLLLDDRTLRNGVSLWSLFEQDRALFRRKDATDIPTRLIVAGSDEIRPALVTPPERTSSVWQDTTSTALHTRPRVDLLASMRQIGPAPQTRGGLPPGATRRVREYVEAHLSESIELAALANIAGLSLYHFARAFKQTAGVTPHQYLLQRRIERAQEMLARTELSLSEIALAAGFSDQSHFARHFRQMLGMTPGQFRRSQR